MFINISTMFMCLLFLVLLFLLLLFLFLILCKSRGRGHHHYLHSLSLPKLVGEGKQTRFPKPSVATKYYLGGGGEKPKLHTPGPSWTEGVA